MEDCSASNASCRLHVYTLQLRPAGQQLQAELLQLMGEAHVKAACMMTREFASVWHSQAVAKIMLMSQP